MPVKPGTSGDDWKPQKRPDEIFFRAIKRRLKATAAIGLAIAAGTFLAFQRSEARPRRPKVPPNPTTPEVSDLPPTPRPDGGTSQAGAYARVPDAPPKARPGAKENWKLEECAPEPGKGNAQRGDHTKKPGSKEKVDREEHRKGMPVPDNLLE